jgi:hypothetical protein
LFLAWWFWISLILDYGFFQLSGIDWVQVLPSQVRAALLGVIVGTLLVVVIRKTLLLFRKFRNSSLALLLERRYPAELGDRLITAVELADERIGDRFGYSQPMIEQTIRDAADRVDRLPVGDVFNWGRLRRLAVRLAVLTIGVYVIGGTGYCLARWRSAGDFIIRFNNVASLWFERNILLLNTTWPRKAYLELIDFPESGDLHVGRDSAPPALRVRAVKWVIADHRAPEGWRAMQWKDLSRILDDPFKDLSAPVSVRQMTIDQIELAFSKPEAVAALGSSAQKITDLLARLEAAVDSPRMERTARKMIVPDKVVICYRGQTTQSDQTLKKQADNEYAGLLTDLRESVQFTARGEDYYTPYKRITIVPPPSLIELARDEEQPAYIHHRPPAGADPEFLRGKRQYFHSMPVSLSGPQSRIEVPAGTNVVLKGKTDKDLRKPGGVTIQPKEGSAPITPLVRLTSESSFEVRFDNLTATLDFILELTDTDNVIGLRPVLIKPTDDSPPDVNVQVEYVRKTREGYKVTPLAELRFAGRVQDDHGLEKIDYAYELIPLDHRAPGALGAAIGLFHWLPRGFGSDHLSMACLCLLAPVRRVPVETFLTKLQGAENQLHSAGWEERIRDKRAMDLEDVLSWAGAVFQPEILLRLASLEMLTHLELEHSGGLVKEFEFDARDPNTYPPDPNRKDGHFSVEALGLSVHDERQTQPRYRMRLWVVAEDNNIETGPGVSSSKERFTFTIVSENELLLEIGKDEESLYRKLEDTINKLKDARSKLDLIIQDLPGLKPQEFSPMARTAEEVADAVTPKGSEATSEIYRDYLRILQELRVNRVNPNFIDKIDSTISQPLGMMISPDSERDHVNFDRVDQSVRAFQKELEAKKADAQSAARAEQDLDLLITRLAGVLESMGRIITINRLIEQLERIEKAERKAYERFKELNEKLQEELFEKPRKP